MQAILTTVLPAKAPVREILRKFVKEHTDIRVRICTTMETTVSGAQPERTGAERLGEKADQTKVSQAKAEQDRLRQAGQISVVPKLKRSKKACGAR